MSQPTARTGPSGLLYPDTKQPTARTATGSSPAHRDWDLEAVLQQIRELAARPDPAPLTDSIRFSIDTAHTLATKAPDLYAMAPEVAARFRLIATFLDTALTEADQAHR